MFRSVSWPRWSGRTLVATALLGAVLAPVVFDHASFPFSTYPMYSSVRSDETSVPTAIAVDSEGDEHRLSLRLIADSDDPLIVASALRVAIADGRADETCEQIASRARDRDYAAIEVVTERHNVVARAAGRDSLVSRETHSRCEIAP
jgi:hypothetical protein